MNRPVRSPAVCLLLVSCLAGGAASQCDSDSFSLGPPESNAGFGRSVALEGDLAVVGAPTHDLGETNEGSVTTLVRQAGGGWIVESPIQGFDTDMHDLFGARVVLDGDTLAVGAYTHDHNDILQGAVFVFRRQAGAWVQEAEVLSTLVFGSGNQFGWSVALEGDVLVVGSGNEAWVEVFRRTGGSWVHEQTLDDPDSDYVDKFGRSVALAGDHLLVGDITSQGAGAGQVHAYRWDGLQWAFHETFIGPEGSPDNGSFGTVLSLDGDDLMVGAPLDEGVGSVWTFSWSGTTWEAGPRLLDAGGEAGDHFGDALDRDGDLLVVGASHANGQRGRVHQFRRIGGAWLQTTSITAPGVALDVGDHFGEAVAVSGESLLIGVPDDDSPTPGGQAWLISADAAWLDLGGALAGTYGEPGFQAFGTLQGGCPVGFHLSGARESSTAALVYGLTELSAPFKGGLMVPMPTWLLPLVTDSAGLVDLQATWPAGIVAGVPVFLQWWVGDPEGPVGFAASNALTVTTP